MVLVGGCVCAYVRMCVGVCVYEVLCGVVMVKTKSGPCSAKTALSNSVLFRLPAEPTACARGRARRGD